MLKGFNDLASVRPDLASEWHPTKNGDLQPSDMTYGSNLKVWWRCHHGHEWETKIAKRTQPFGTGCPTCTNRIVLKGFNDLATTHPELANEWHPTKNGDLQPTDVSAGSSKRVWWQCKQGHEWQSSVNARNHHQTGCPVCTGKKVLVGFNDFAEWHPTKNGDLQPTDVSFGANKKVWWQCPRCGHEWQKTLNARTSTGQIHLHCKQ